MPIAVSYTHLDVYKRQAWGNVISITDNNGNVITNPNHIGNLNPFRYRGYDQHTETGLYYLMSRYYDPITCLLYTSCIRKYFYFESIREIAKRYSFTESKVKNMLFYTRNKLKDYLIKEGVEI